ncbi:MAG: nucleoside deaminase [Rhodospirillales bacterium]|jgi:tRNA(Arg) A34 adenosine deaminase TadA|nr:nucleoside deaminase [Rhodospirillales bacterium]HJO72435.1 nucleoside deaminase [Rhodospirillales bacterium]
MPDQATKERFLRRAIEVAYETFQSGRGRPFGAVVVKDGEIIAEGPNEVPHLNDPTAHAEVMAIRRAGEALGTHDLSGCTMYVNGASCPMCSAAILWAKIDKVYYAATAEDGEEIGFDDNAMFADLARPIEERAFKAERVDSLRDEGRACYAAWYEKTGGIR